MRMKVVPREAGDSRCRSGEPLWSGGGVRAFSPPAQSAVPWPLPCAGARASGVTTRVGLAAEAPGALGAATSPPADAHEEEEEEEEEEGEERRPPRSSWCEAV
ncbi:hypothetical protein C0J50_18751 [Silurus asotus]|uniref:Uncharacterized protein n=1 Tax=Silurus asotus TaxID=30991 RepID=A0AAD5ARW7_SILAS|nr:hypothetical protein C0J50_18751 [Silurus asotus]